MANESTNSTVISQDNSGFPPYLDFNALRTSSIDYLSSLTGKVWTDYNVHDPGITILEMLIYALLDLGYRTNFSAIDIFTKGPPDSEKENNFFTPAQILSCNPLTITDFRKLLIDIDGVKNAWLTIATDVNIDTICNPPTSINGPAENTGEHALTPYLNGLYHISIEPDDASLRSEECIIGDVKNALLAHRNLCEDFVDISVLCYLDIGICADVVIDSNASSDEVYRDIVVKLNDFFSPAPKFYTLQQLLDKKKTIDNIFAGRPFNFKDSHGFVDTDEFEKIELKKEINLSDVYNVILSINGVKTVRKLTLRESSDKSFSQAWQFALPDKYLPRFSTDISAIQLSSKGIRVPVDTQKNLAYLKIASGSTTKVIKLASDLDLDVPKGIYHSDLADYYSIQNEFPLVYGIGEGGLPDSAPLKRKAQALQLKSYLLFFDHLLANYLTQLNSIRSIFSFASATNADEQHTYFVNDLNKLNTVPDFLRLITNISDNNGASAAGNNGSIFAYPVAKKDLEKLLEQDGFSSNDIKHLQQQYSCKTKDEYEIIASLLQNDFTNYINSPSSAVATSDHAYFCYIDTSDSDISLTGNIFAKADAAQNAMQLLPYFASLPESYNSYFSNGAFKFNIQLHLPTYLQYLQQISEDTTKYRTRRDGFLNHLLSRFAEQFTDFALLSYGFMEKAELTDATIKNKEIFLTQYPLLSSMRGKGFDYRLTENGNDENISGFETKFRAYAGIDNDVGNSLCNFEVDAYEDTYSVKLKLEGFHFFDINTRYEGDNKAQETLQAIFSNLWDPDKYIVVPAARNSYQLQVHYGNNEVAYYPKLLQKKTDATELADNLQQMFNLKIKDENIVADSYLYRMQLKDDKGNVTRSSVNTFNNEEDGFASSISDLKAPNDTSKWQIISADKNPSGRFCSNNKKKPEKLIDIDRFTIDINNNIIGKPDMYNYELLDKDNNAFRFVSLNEFTSENLARKDCYRLLMLLANADNYEIKEGRRQKLYIVDDEKPVAEYTLKAGEKAKDFLNSICSFVKSHFYHLSADPFPYRWKFTFQLGFEKDNILLFESDKLFENIESVKAAAENFNTSLSMAALEVINGKYTLKTPGNKASNLTCNYAGSEIVKEEDEAKISHTKRLLALRQKINELLQSEEKKSFDEGVEIDDISKDGRNVYRLVDKENLLAFNDVGENEASTGLNDLYNNAVEGYQVLDICLGGDITESYTNPKTKEISYRYLVRCHRDFGEINKDVALFKSIATYDSADDAEVAFNENYLFILNKASDSPNYGEGKYIMLSEPKANTRPGLSNETIVFVPHEITAMKPDDANEIIPLLVNAAKSYPVKIVENCSDEFKKLYPENICPVGSECLPLAVVNDCATIAAEYKYYFTLYNMQSLSIDWQSVKFYQTSADARQAFYFFRMLLSYKGNYVINKDGCGTQTIYVREVLAESTGRFKDQKDEPNAPDAWGKEGVEKFICITQSPNAFHSFIDYKNGGYTFHVACDTANAIHPCKYDSPEQRDASLDKLKTSYENFRTKKLFEITDADTTSGLLHGLDDAPLVRLFKIDEQDFTCQTFLDLFELAATDENYKDGSDNDYWIVSADKNNLPVRFAEPYDNRLSKREWKERLLELAYYYPIKKSSDSEFCVKIRFPQFNTLAKTGNQGSISKCQDTWPDNDDDCYVAWQTVCCFDTCDKAFDKYKDIIALLGNYDNYRPFFDCECYSFGIALQADKDIIAFNPQRYLTPDMVCEAIARSQRLINSEGLRLVEHILLRPRCEGDCVCDYLAKTSFTNKTDCGNLFWKEEIFIAGNDEEESIPFVPGADPFSFIATLVLPAWPLRFRNQKNRELLETMLNREAPAHVLLRILWLNPSNICSFEFLYKEWKLWLLQKEDCDRKAIVCDFMKFLFETDFDCLNDCSDCQPCTKSDSVATCLEDAADKSITINNYEGLGNINDLFGWKKFNCEQLETAIMGTANNSGLIQDTGGGAAPSVVREYRELTVEEATLLQKKTRRINARLGRYKKNIARIFVNSNENPIAGRANRVFAEKNPAEKISGLINDLLSDQNPKNSRQKLKKAQKDDLLKNLIWLYLDKMILVENNISQMDMLTDSFNKMRAANFDMALLFDEWEPAEMSKYETDANIDAIRQLLVKQ